MPLRLHPDSLSQRPWLSWLLFLAPGLLLYLPAWKAGFQQDFQGWLMMYQDLSFADILDRKGASEPSLYHLTQAQLYFWTTLFGTRQILWFLLFAVMHATNRLLLFRLATRIFRDFGLKHAATIGFLGALLFLVHPATSEVMVWKACYHYHVAMLMALLILGWTRRFVLTGEMRYALFANGLLLLATTTLEFWYVFPWMALSLGIVYLRCGIVRTQAFFQMLKWMFLPMLLIFVGYLFVYHFRYGMWMGRGAYANSDGIAFLRQFGRVWIYESHIWLGGRLWPGQLRSALHHFAGTGPGWISAVLVLAGFFLLGWLRMRRAGSLAGPVTLFAAWAFLGLAIVLHFHPEELFLISNDRHLYFTGAFQCLVLILLLARIFRKKVLFTSVVTLLLSAAVINTVYYAWCWRKAGKIFYGIQYNYHWDDAPLTLLLNIPSGFRGVGIMHANPNEELQEHLRVFYGRKPAGRIVDVAEYNMVDPSDGAHVRVLDSNTVKVTLNQWGTWWMYWRQGLSAYETDYYSVTPDPTDGQSYILTLKQQVPGMVIVYSQGDQWRQVDMRKRGEQW